MRGFRKDFAIALVAPRLHFRPGMSSFSRLPRLARLAPPGFVTGLVLLACGGSNGSLFTAPLDDGGSSGASSGASGGTSNGSSGASGGTSGSSGTSGTGSSGTGSSGTSGGGHRDAGTPVDAGLPDSPASDGASSNPVVVVCGATTCAVGTQACCTDQNGTSTCVSTGNECKNGTLLKCDEKADCAPTQVCCLTRQSETLVGSCQLSCTGG